MPDKPKWTEILPPEGHEKVGEEAFKILAEVIQDKVNLGLHQKWQRNYELRKNKQWKNQGTSGVNLVTANLIYTHITRTTNTMTDNDPTFNLVALTEVDESNGVIYEDLQKAAESWWIDTEQSDDFARTVVNGENYGICVEKIVFDKDLEGGIGEVDTVLVDPFHFGWYPTKLTDPKRLQQCLAVLHYYPLTVREVKRRWGKKAEEVKPDQDLIKELGDSRREVAAGKTGIGNMLISLSGVVKNLLNWGSGNAPENEETLVCELWAHDYSKPDYYPGNIRIVTFCNGGKVVLEDRPNPNVNPDLPPEEAKKTYLYDKFPFSAANPVPDTSNAWGMCYDAQTEILTKEKGFVWFKDLTAFDEVATRNKNGEFEWQRPTHYTAELYAGEMYHFSSRSMDIMVTPNHRMLVSMMKAEKGKRREKIILAKDLAENINHERKIPVTSKWTNDKELQPVFFPRATKMGKDLSLSGDDYCALLGAYLAEGSVKNSGGIEIAQKQTSKGYKKYKEMFDRIGAKYNGRSFFVWSKALRDEFSALGKSHEKYVPSLIKNLPVRQLKILWEYFVLGDGNFKKRPNKSGRGNPLPTTTHITTVSRRLADDLVEIGQKLGFSVSVSEKPEGECVINGKTSKSRKAYLLCCRHSDCMAVNARRWLHVGMIYCVTVPNGIVYVRRNGKPCWSGNSDIEQIEQLQIEINKALSQFLYFKDKAARQKLINPMTSGVENHEFTNSSSVIRPANAIEAAAIKWLGAPESNIDIEKAIAMLKEIFFLVAGTFELDQAQVQGREVIAYKAIAALLERAATMMRGKIRAYNRMIRERGRMYLSHVMNFYTEERWIQFNDSKTGKTMAKKINRGTDMIVPAKLTVVSGSTLPVSRVQRREEALALHAKGAIDQQALLEALEWPNRNDVVQRMQLGVLGKGLQKLQAMQIPPEIIDVLGQVMSLEDKEFEKLAKQGEIPTIQDIMTMLTQGQGTPPDPGKMAEQAESQAKAEKMSAEAALLAERILTERVKQQQILKGVEFDEETMAMERAKLVAELERSSKDSMREDFRAAHEAVKGAAEMKVKSTMAMNRPGFNDRKLKSDNVQP